jgi:hypothetical protein
MDYLEKQQYPQRKEFVTAWTSKIRHFGNITTSPVEGMHSTLKTFLHSSTGDLLRTVKAIELRLITFNSQFRQTLASHRDRVPFDVRPSRIPIFPANINLFASPFALRLVKRQWELAKSREHEPICTGSFTKTYGLPCCHKIQRCLNLNSKWFLTGDHIHAHWWFERPPVRDPLIGQGPALRLPSPPVPTHETVLEPSIVRARGRPRQEDRDTTTRRDPSQWEIPVAPRSRRDGDSNGNDITRRGRGSTRSRSRGATPRGSRMGREADMVNAISAIASSMEALTDRLQPQSSSDPIIQTTVTTQTTVMQTTGPTQRSGEIQRRGGYTDIDELVAYEVPETVDLIHEPPTPERRAASRRRMA